MSNKKQFITKKNNLLQKISIYLIINLHQKRISNYLKKKGTRCRFYPSCSNYGLMAIEKYGFLKGWIKTIKRILRCRPNNYGSCVDYP
ncbi:MAG: membrane protein insertion efficiency factor YidD [Nanoarchaeota archaeon]|nr:membrane protein insertion efficiency factor YidD [Nanoarchaeota archaeon]